MTTLRKLQFDKADSKQRYKRLMFLLNNPEEAEQAELDRVCAYAEWMAGRMEGAIDFVHDLLEELEDPDSEWRQEIDALKTQTDEALNSLGKAITRCEDALIAKYKGRCAAVELEFPPRRGAKPKETALIFWHRKGVWGLYVIVPDGGFQRLGSASKAVRMAAMEALEDLLQGLQYEDEAA
jgi:hypothetical protein